jgi:hypothetical protein
MAPQKPPVDDTSELLNLLLGPLRTHFLVASTAYEDYLQNGRSYLFACSLRRTNSSARGLLLAWGHLLPSEHTSDALALLRHYDVWVSLWDHHAAELNPSMDDPFVFESKVTFPKSAQERLMHLYERCSAY